MSWPKYCWIPQRYVVGIMGFWCFAIAYMLRVCLNIAITQMVVDNNENNTKDDPDRCPSEAILKNSSLSEFRIHAVYDWDEKLQGIILGSFYYGYILTHVPGGLIAEKYGAKYTAGLGLLVTSICTIATPYLLEIGGASILIVVRVIEGFGEGPTFPALAALMSRWVPRDERGILGSLIFGGAQIGNILGMLISGFIMSKDGNWPLVFYVFGGLGLVWFICWTILVYSEPESNPFISDEEKNYLASNIEKRTTKPVPWRPFLTSIPVWAIVIAAIGHDWGYMTMISDLPKYMTDVMRFDIESAGILSALPYIVMMITSLMFGFICDYLIKKNILSIKNSRKIYTSIASIGPGIFLLLAGYAGCDTKLSVAMFTIAMGLMGAYYCGMKVNILDLTPNYAGIGTALINGTAAISGIITPYIVGVVAPDKTKKQWQIVFWIVFVVLTVTDIVYVIYAEGEEQWWNDIRVDNNMNSNSNVSTRTTRKNSVTSVSDKDNVKCD